MSNRIFRGRGELRAISNRFIAEFAHFGVSSPGHKVYGKVGVRFTGSLELPSSNPSDPSNCQRSRYTAICGMSFSMHRRFVVAVVNLVVIKSARPEQVLATPWGLRAVIRDPDCRVVELIEQGIA